jgi:hypothetical protein
LLKKTFRNEPDEERVFRLATTLRRSAPILCHLDRSAAQWRDLCADALSWECFSSPGYPHS